MHLACALSLSDEHDKDRPRIVEHLLGLGAKIDAKDNEGNTPLHYAAKIGHSKLVALLSDYDPDLLNIPNNEGETPRHLAATRAHAKTVESLLYGEIRSPYTSCLSTFFRSTGDESSTPSPFLRHLLPQ